MEKLIFISPVIFLLLILFSNKVTASSTSGQVNVVLSMVQNGVFFIDIGSAPDRPACSNGNYVIPLTGPNAASGKVAIAIVLQAIALGKKITIVGTGVCDLWGDRETVNYLFMSS